MADPSSKPLIFAVLSLPPTSSTSLSLPPSPPKQDQGSYPSAPHVPGPGNAMANQQGGNPMAGNHGNAAYLSGQAAQAQALKQQQQQQQMQLMEQQQQYLRAQRQQQLMAGEQVSGESC